MADEPLTLDMSPEDVQMRLQTLSQKEAWDYRQELIQAIHNPGTEFSMSGEDGQIDRDAYLKRLGEVDTYLKTFAIQI